MILSLESKDGTLYLTDTGLTSEDLAQILRNGALTEKLSKLCTLILSNNQITTIPEKIEEYQKLIQLHLDQNLLSVATTSYLSVNGSRINVIYHVRDTEPQQASGYGVILNQICGELEHKDQETITTLFQENNELQNFLLKTQPLNEERKEALNYLLSKLLTTDAEIL